MTQLRCIVTFDRETPEEEILRIRKTADVFSCAIERGFFFPAQLSRPPEIESGRITSDGRLTMEVGLTVESFALEWLSVLEGMYEWLRINRGITLRLSYVYADGAPIRIPTERIEHILQKAVRPFSVSVPEFMGMGESFTLLLRFAYGLNENRREELEQGFTVWESLVRGGFPTEDGAPGDSTIGASSGFLVAPTVYRYFVEGMAADMACLDVLFNFFSAGGNRFGLVSAEVED